MTDPATPTDKSMTDYLTEYWWVILIVVVLIVIVIVIIIVVVKKSKSSKESDGMDSKTVVIPQTAMQGVDDYARLVNDRGN